MDKILKLSADLTGFFKGLYTETMRALEMLLVPETRKYRICYSFQKHLLDRNNRILDELTAVRVAQFYESFQAKIYYISASGMHGHPHEALLNGLIKAAVAKNNKCTVLLSTGSVLHYKRLPDPKEWKGYVTFMSLDEGSVFIDPETIKIKNARVYNPHSTNDDSWERISNTLNKSSASEYFRKWVGESKEICKITTNSPGKLHFV